MLNSRKLKETEGSTCQDLPHFHEFKRCGTQLLRTCWQHAIRSLTSRPIFNFVSSAHANMICPIALAIQNSTSMWPVYELNEIDASDGSLFKNKENTLDKRIMGKVLAILLSRVRLPDLDWYHACIYMYEYKGARTIQRHGPRCGRRSSVFPREHATRLDWKRRNYWRVYVCVFIWSPNLVDRSIFQWSFAAVTCCKCITRVLVRWVTFWSERKKNLALEG
jgi:hypothetical protein